MAGVVLVVDDSMSVRRLIEFTLKSKGYGVAAAADGQEALTLLESGHFDLMVLDINMPHLDGLSLLKILRERPQWADLPVLVETAEGQDEDRDRALLLGATGCIDKPFKPTELLSRVASLLDQG